MRFFSKHSSANTAAAYIAPRGLSISLATEKNRHPRRYGPGAIIHGQVNLSLTKPILHPCKLRVVFTCAFTLHSAEGDDSYAKNDLLFLSPTTHLFEVEHLLIDNQPLPACGRQAPLHFCIKLPLCNYPPSMREGKHSVTYTLQAILSFDASLENASVVKSSTSSLPVEIIYVPHVTHTSIAVGRQQQTIPGVTNAAAVATTSCRPSQSSAPRHETHGQWTFESRAGAMAINASVQSRTSVCIGDHASLVLTVENNSDITLQTIRLALVRQISFSASANVSSRFAGNISTNPYSTQIFPSATISSTVHTATIPVAKVSNQNSTWTQQLQFKIPSHLNLIPTINKSITPLFDVEYFIVLSLPVPQRQGSFVSRLADSARRRPSMDLSIFSSNQTSSSTSGCDATHPLLSTSPPSSTDALSSSFSKTTMNLQLPHIPIALTSISPFIDDRRYLRPIPHHMEVEDRPSFVRDRFEEEMIRELSSLESLVMDGDSDDNDDLDDDISVEKKSLDDTDDETEDEEPDEAENDPRFMSRIPTRFRKPIQNNSLLGSSMDSRCLSISPSSPQYHTKVEPPSVRNMAISNSIHALGSSAAANSVVFGNSGSGGLNLGPRSCGLHKDVLMDLYQNNSQQPRSSI